MPSAASLSREFAARLGGAHRDEPGSLLGIEQEFTVVSPSHEQVDFRDLLPELPLVGVRLDPMDRWAVRTRCGVVVTADGREAEAVTPPIAVRHGCAREAEGWAGAARDEVEHALGGTHGLFGYSTHLSVSVDDVRNPRIGALYARTFAAGMMLLVDRRTSPGLIVRPRPGRTELCGEFVDGPWLRAASVYAIGSVLACRDAIRDARPFSSLPPQLDVVVRPSSTRAGWYVDRRSFGADLLHDGRSTRLRRCDARRIRAQDHLEASWAVARAALGDRVGADDIAAVNELVDATVPLPCEMEPAPLDVGATGPRPEPSPLGAVGEARIRPAFVVEAHAATWRWTVFRVRARAGTRAAYASVPRAHHERFFALLDRGELDELLDGYLALESSGRALAMTGSEPSLGDVAPGDAVVGELELDRVLAATVPGAEARGRKVVIPAPAGIGPPILETRRGCLPRTRWIVVGGVVVALAVASGLFALLGGDGGDTSTTAPPAVGSVTGSGSDVACGAGTGGLTIGWDVITESCRLTLSGEYNFFPQTEKPYRTVTVTTSAGQLALEFGATCKIHDATASELDAAKDPTNQFRGLSLLGVPTAGLPPGAVVEVVLLAPDGQTLRTGRATADSNGYAEVRVPINVPQAHTIRSVKVWANGNVSSTAVEIPPTDVTSDAKIDGTFPGNRCDRASTLADVKIVGESLTADQVKAIVKQSAALWPPLLALAGPGGTVDQTPKLSADGSEGYAEITGFATGFDLWPGTAKGRDPTGAVPAYIDSYGGTLVYPSTGGTAELWEDAFGCGPNQLTLGVCTPAKAKLRDVGYLKVGAVFDRPVPLQPSGSATYTVTAGSVTVELTARGGKWSLSGPDDARALLRNNTVFVLVPADAAGAADYRIATKVGSRTDVQPAADQPPLAVTTVVRAAVPPGGHETTEQFVDALSRALATGDAAFLKARLHPAVLDRYGDATCNAYVAAANTPTTIVAKGVDAPSVYAWQTDGLSRDVANVNSVVATRDGAEVTLHVALVDGTWRWFTDCGTPQPGAR